MVQLDCVRNALVARCVSYGRVVTERASAVLAVGYTLNTNSEIQFRSCCVELRNRTTISRCLWSRRTQLLFPHHLHLLLSCCYSQLFPNCSLLDSPHNCVMNKRVATQLRHLVVQQLDQSSRLAEKRMKQPKLREQTMNNRKQKKEVRCKTFESCTLLCL